MKQEYISSQHFTFRVLAFCLILNIHASISIAQEVAENQVAQTFRQLLDRPATRLKPSFTIEQRKDVIIERGFFYAEANEKVPVLIYKPIGKKDVLYPAVICLHGTGGSKDDQSIRQFLEKFSRKGIMAVAIDARYHGDRVKGGAKGSQQYIDAISNAWKNQDSTQQQHPFFLDTVYDLWRLVDYLVSRKDVQTDRIGMMGISMGGIETWMAAAIDKRIKVIVPIIAVQSFKWSLENNRWRGRAGTIWPVHQQVAKELGDSMVTAENVRLVWAKLLPGITGKFDCPSMIRLLAPRPTLLLNNAEDENCPLPGAELAFAAARNAWSKKNATEKLKIDVSPNEPHRLTSHHVTAAVNWFFKWL